MIRCLDNQISLRILFRVKYEPAFSFVPTPQNKVIDKIMPNVSTFLSVML